MNELRNIFLQSEQLQNRYDLLSDQIPAADRRFSAREQELTEAFDRTRSELKQALASEQERNSFEQETQIGQYTQMQELLQELAEQVSHLCPQDELEAYIPDPSQICEEDVRELIAMTQEGGFLAWIKRTFRLGGYGSRSEMAMSAMMQIKNAWAYCEKHIESIRQTCEQQQKSCTDRHRQALRTAEEQLEQQLDQARRQRRSDREQASAALQAFFRDPQFLELHESLRDLRQEADRCNRGWEQYQVPREMPGFVQLCDARVPILGPIGNRREDTLPLRLDLFTSNIVVITSGSQSAADPNSPEKLLIRQFLARMLKTIPPEAVSYSIFDTLNKGSSLGRLVDVMNIGTTELHFELFTHKEPDPENRDILTAPERRRYLCNRPAQIIQFLAGRSNSLFDFSRRAGEFEFPFSWIVDFDFPSKPDDELRKDIQEMFVNASTAGYSFLFITDHNGLAQLQAIAAASKCPPILHLDIPSMTCSQKELCLPLVSPNTPGEDQLHRLISSLKKFYEDGSLINNRIDAVFADKGLKLLDASKSLSIPIALDRRGRTVDLQLGGEGSVHGFISGGTGSGKTTLIHTIILSACLHYAPEDLEIWLVDYKGGLDFKQYQLTTPPHIKLIGMTQSPDFSFSFLDQVHEEAQRRTRLMQQFAAPNLEEYRKHRGKPGYVELPRLFIIIDEFHRMSQHLTENFDYKDKLENIVREYRAQAVTLLLADQTFSTGLSGLSPSAKLQLGLRIAMRNEGSPQEVKDTLEVDRSFYSDAINKSISLMSRGDFIQKVYLRNKQGALIDIRLDKFRAMYSKTSDIAPIAQSLQQFYAGRFDPSDQRCVDTVSGQIPWSMTDIQMLDRLRPLQHSDIRLNLGRSATLVPAFAVDLIRRPKENISIVGGTTEKRLTLIASILQSCLYRGYQAKIFLAEYSAMEREFSRQIRQMCAGIPNAVFCDTTALWCRELEQLDQLTKNRDSSQDIICIFLGLDIAREEFETLPSQDSSHPPQTVPSYTAPAPSASFMASPIQAPPAPTAPAELSVVGLMAEFSWLNPDSRQTAQPSVPQVPAFDQIAQAAPEFNALHLIDELFRIGSRYGIHAVCEFSDYKDFEKMRIVSECCRHKVAFSISSEDSMFYLGSSKAQQQIGAHAVYTDGTGPVQKLIPYSISL